MTAEVPDPARGSRPSGAGPHGPRAGSPALVAPGVARHGRGLRAAAPTWAGAGTCGRGDLRLEVGPRHSFPRLPPPPAPHLRAVLQRLLDRQLVDPRHRGGGRAEAGTRWPPTVPHSDPPTAADPDPPSPAGSAAAPPAQPSLGAWLSGGKSRPLGLRAPPPGALIGSRRRLSARRGWPRVSFVSPGSAASAGLPGGAPSFQRVPTVRARGRV